jgi:hypothetical protein
MWLKVILLKTGQSLLNKDGDLCHLIKEAAQSRRKEMQVQFLGMVLQHGGGFCYALDHKTVFTQKTEQMCHMMLLCHN